MFINKGERQNRRQLASDPLSHRVHGVYAGVVGARFEREGYMEDEFMILRPADDQTHLGPGQGLMMIEPMEDGSEKWTFRRSGSLNTGTDEPRTHKELWLKFYKETCRFPLFYSPTAHRRFFPTYEEALKEMKGQTVTAFTISPAAKKAALAKPTIFNEHAYARRILSSLDLFLSDANLRGEEIDKPVLVYIVGYGLGVWAHEEFKAEQERGFARALFDLLIRRHWPNISHIHLSGFSGHFAQQWAALAKKHPQVYNVLALKTIEISFFSSKDYEAAKVAFGTLSYSIFNGIPDERVKVLKKSGAREAVRLLPAVLEPAEIRANNKLVNNMLLCASYAWDGNSLPGNEYWYGLFDASGDPAAASCSTISEVQNAEINTDYFNERAILRLKTPDPTAVYIESLYLLNNILYERLHTRERIESRPGFVPTSGSIQMDDMELIFNKFREAGMNESSHFFDIGSGQGQVVIHAALRFNCEATGIEYVKERVEDSNDLVAYMRALLKMDYAEHEESRLLKAKFIHGDATDPADKHLVYDFFFSFDRLHNKSTAEATQETWTKHIEAKILAAPKFKRFLSFLAPENFPNLRLVEKLPNLRMMSLVGAPETHDGYLYALPEK